MFPKFSQIDLDTRNFDFPTEERFIASIDGVCCTGEFAYYVNSANKTFVSDGGRSFPLTSIEKLWSINDNQTPPSVQEAIMDHNPLVHGTLPLVSYPGWYFVVEDYNQHREFLRLYLVLPDVLLRGLNGSNITFGEEFSDLWGFRFTEASPTRTFFKWIHKSENRETALAECLQLVNNISREINSCMSKTTYLTPIIFGDIHIGCIKTSTCFNGIEWEGIIEIDLLTGDGRYLKHQLTSPTRQGIEDRKKECVKVIIDTFKNENQRYNLTDLNMIMSILSRHIQVKEQFDFIIYRADMNKYYHGPNPRANIQIGTYHMTTSYQHDKRWTTELSLHIPTTSEGIINIPYMEKTILETRASDTEPSLFGERLWPLWGSYTRSYRFRTVVFSGLTSDESRKAALEYVKTEKEQLLANSSWKFDN